ncbi:MAG: hypothetical protein QXD62_04100 [Candidatus Woesearchaeota archaeon]
MVKKFVFFDVEEMLNSNSEELAKIICYRLGIVPRKNKSNAGMHKVLIELYERKKLANQQKKPELAIMTVEEMALFAGIKRQTMYEYLQRLIIINLIKKSSYVSQGNVIRGYMLNGNTLEDALNKVRETMDYFFEKTKKIILEFQRVQKNEKISSSLKNQLAENGENS